MADRTYYAQHGEDALVLSAFAAPGYFVDIGALDGVFLSNTKALEEDGWTGLLIEAHPEHFATLAETRPGAQRLHAAVADREGELTFYATSFGSLSTFDKAQRDYFIKNRSDVTEDSYTEYQVRAGRTTTLLQEAGVPRDIDMLSIDIEGAELPALEGLDFDAFDIKLLIVEKDDARAKADIEHQVGALLQSKGYHVARRLGANDFWVKDLALSARLRDARVDAVLAHGGEIHMDPGENTTPRGFWRRLRDSYNKRFG